MLAATGGEAKKVAVGKIAQPFSGEGSVRSENDAGPACSGFRDFLGTCRNGPAAAFPGLAVPGLAFVCGNLVHGEEDYPSPAFF